MPASYNALMTKLLLIKTSSLGDVIHALPALTDALRFNPSLKVDWLVEESFRDIPQLHKGLNRIQAVALRRWKKHWLHISNWYELVNVIKNINTESYDLSVDCQGLLKSALLCRVLPGLRHGYHWDSIREPLASLCYQYTHHISWQLHAVERNRQLLGQVLGYTPDTPVDYGIVAPPLSPTLRPSTPWVVFLHATSRTSKEWPVDSWIRLGHHLARMGITVLLPSGNIKEENRAQHIAQQIDHAIALPRLDLTTLASLLQEAEWVVGVDTGLTHLAVALKQKVIAIYTDTDPQATGVYGGERATNVGGIGMVPDVESILKLCL
ncbi:MAG: lipopolysaccharide heptosyltransferase I [Ferrovum sp. 21-44-67]|nr:lipopolysaccharide heptosyltransferase 1 [Ferrovum sp. JA12]OYV79352.1 MAG: lipopolysaccharide heptosyltransferase I [Ferrovum sp. 21-44-67]